VIRDRAELLTLAKKRAALVCGVQTTLSVIDGHWKLPILFRLLDGTRRFGELKRHLPAATQRMLTLHLRELERDGLIHREVYREVPPKVEYSLTDTGRSLEPLLRFMSQWGHANRDALVAAIQSLAGGTADPTAVGHPAVTERTAVARDGGGNEKVLPFAAQTRAALLIRDSTRAPRMTEGSAPHSSSS
jgi:DNA-binding HxlR family transcriptional regulator